MTSFTLTSITTSAQTLGNSETGYISATGAILGAGLTMGPYATFVNDGRLFNRSGTAITVTDLNAYIENHGTISSDGGLAVIDSYSAANARGLHLLNFGDITSGVFSETSGILSNSGGNFIENHGTISTLVDAAIEIYNGTNPDQGNWIINSGLISSMSVTTIYVQSNAINRFTNSGTVNGAVVIGGNLIGRNSGEINGDFTFGEGWFANSGLIQGNVGSNGSSSVSLRNSGWIDGNVVLGSQYIDVTISGVVSGTIQVSGIFAIFNLRGGQVLGGVSGTLGDDTYWIDDPTLSISDGGGTDIINAWCDVILAEGIETLNLRGPAVLGQGNTLANTITGNGMDNRIEAGDGHDTLLGNAGADLLAGEEGDDQLTGDRGDDTLNGGIGVDSLSGGIGGDLLIGGAGNDQLLGGDGGDRLQGDGGADTLTGGAGRDWFVLTLLGDSGTTVATRDTFGDFVSGTDGIDLSGIDAKAGVAGDQAFTLAAALTGTAGQLALRVAGANGFLEGDVDGDGTADFSVRLLGVTALTLGDLLL